MSSPPTAAAGDKSQVGQAQRVGGLDALRGLAILLMVADHALIVGGHSASVLRVATRPAFWLFMLIAGALWRPGLRRRHVEALGVGIVSEVLHWFLVIPRPNIVLVFLVASLLMRWAMRAPWGWLVVSLGVGVSFGWPWGGYSPLWALSGLLIGAMVGVPPTVRSRNGPRWLQAVGRRPLAWYVGHLVVLYIVKGTLL